MAKGYKYESGDLKAEFRRLRDRIYRSAKRGYIDKEMYEMFRDTAMNGFITQDLIDWGSGMYEMLLADRREGLAEMTQEEREVDEQEYDYYTPSQLDSAYNNFFNLINNQPDQIDGHISKRRQKNKVKYKVKESYVYPNEAKFELLQKFNMWEAALGHDGIAKVYLEHYDVIETIANLLEFAYHTDDPEYHSLLESVDEFFDNIVFEE